MIKSPFKIKEINMSSTWVYNVPKNNDCTICRCNLNVPSLYHQEKGIDSYVLVGKCQHSFHSECINPWIEKNKHCPICSDNWQFININKNPETFVTKNGCNHESNKICANCIDNFNYGEDINLNSYGPSSGPTGTYEKINIFDKKINKLIDDIKEVNKTEKIINMPPLSPISNQEKIINIFKKSSKKSHEK